MRPNNAYGVSTSLLRNWLNHADFEVRNALTQRPRKIDHPHQREAEALPWALICAVPTVDIEGEK